MELSKNNVKVDKIKIDDDYFKKTPEMNKLLTIMAKHGTQNGYELLPKAPLYRVSFELHDTYAEFANAIRRTLISRVPVSSLLAEEFLEDGKTQNIETDDEFVSGATNILIKTISGIPISQNEKYTKNFESYGLSLNVYNNSIEIIDVMASDIKTNKANITDIIPTPNILITRLRPGKYLNIKKFKIQTETGDNDANSFTLLNNVSYNPIMVPYNAETGEGEKSMTYNCQKFNFSYLTKGNVPAIYPIQKTCDVLNESLDIIKKKIDAYAEAKSDIYYTGQDIEVSITNGVYEFVFHGNGISETFMLAKCCYKLDPNGELYNATIRRYESKIGILRIKHAEPIKILLDAILACKKDLQIVHDAFAKK